MGGMFDPVHYGHLSTALAAQQEFELDQVRLLPCGTPVHRENSIASALDRINMLRLSIAGEEKLLVDDRECRSHEPSYMYNTLESLKADFPNSRFFLILGADAFSHFSSWYRWQDIFQLAHLLVITRPGSDLSTNKTGNPEQDFNTFFARREVSSFSEMLLFDHGKILKYTFSPLTIASSQLRRLIKENKSVRFLLPDVVNDYIHEHHLYR